MQYLSQLPVGTSAPNTVLTMHAVQSLHLQLSLAAYELTLPAPLANLEIQSPVTEAFLLGCLAQRFPGERLDWDAANMKITNFEKANKCVDPPARSGFGA